ncbi:MAG: ribbon-helix-helix protein, CopG family [bacterium]
MINKTKRKILNISMSSELFDEVEKLAREQAKAKGEFVREVIRQYIESDRRWKQIRKWGEETAQKFGIRSDAAIENIVEEYRKERSQ